MRFYVLLALLSLIEAEQRLRFVQVWFRHGERTPTNYLAFPTDPPIDTDSLPFTAGDLTQNGIAQEYALGQRLRQDYGGFLGDYASGKILAHAGEDNRTIASGQAMLAGLFPPATTVIADLLWQPIPVHTRSNLDEVSFGIFGKCPGLERKLNEDPNYQAMMDSIDPSVLDLLRTNTGLPLLDPYQYQNVLDSLNTKLAINSSVLPYPDWAIPLIPSLSGLINSINTPLTKLMNATSGGFHADLLLSRIEEQLDIPSRKAFFLSGHDTNLVTLGGFLKVKTLYQRLCQYAGHLAIEVHEDTTIPVTPDSLIIKLFYSPNLTATREELFIPACSVPCTLASMQQITVGKRWSERRWRDYCEEGVDLMVDSSSSVNSSGNGTLTGPLLIAVAILAITSIFLLYFTCSYRKKLEALRDSEKRPLIS